MGAGERFLPRPCADAAAWTRQPVRSFCCRQTWAPCPGFGNWDRRGCQRAPVPPGGHVRLQKPEAGVVPALLQGAEDPSRLSHRRCKPPELSGPRSQRGAKTSPAKGCPRAPSPSTRLWTGTGLSSARHTDPGHLGGMRGAVAGGAQWEFADLKFIGRLSWNSPFLLSENLSVGKQCQDCRESCK